DLWSGDVCRACRDVNHCCGRWLGDASLDYTRSELCRCRYDGGEQVWSEFPDGENNFIRLDIYPACNHLFIRRFVLVIIESILKRFDVKHAAGVAFFFMGGRKFSNLKIGDFFAEIEDRFLSNGLQNYKGCSLSLWERAGVR